MIPRHAGLLGLVLLAAPSVWAQETQQPPFVITGTALAFPTSLAAVELLDERGRVLGETVMKENEVVDGYRVVAIREGEVIFERRGRTFVIPVRAAQSGSATVPAITAPDARTPPQTTTAPSAVQREDIERRAAMFIQRLKDNGDFRASLEDVRRRLRERESRRQSSP